MSVAAVVIGRNEGARLIACLDALAGQVDHIVYVDSGSTDGSVAAAKARGAEVVTLDMTRPFTAARARNAGFDRVADKVACVQFLDGDCMLRDGWIDTAARFLDENHRVAVVCGRRRERHPEASVYNALIDAEWDTPIGSAKACGGDALIRSGVLRHIGGYREDLIAGEEPEMCVRLRAAGWGVHRLDAEMTWHDADMTRFGQWWQRSKRAGHAFAEGAALHGAAPERHWVKETVRAVLWGLALPVAILCLALLITHWAMLLALIYPAQIARLARQQGLRWALFNTLSKFAEAHGILSYAINHAFGAKKRLIEYK